MDDTGFKLGQLLAAADAVHMGYCADVRGGDIPPTLIGNSVFALAGRDPVRALDVLQTRWKPYGAWARRADQARERAAKAKSENLTWTIRRGLSQARLAGQLCEELRPLLARMREENRAPDEAFRAELLLGYVAGLKPEPKTADTNATAGEEIAA